MRFRSMRSKKSRFRRRNKERCCKVGISFTVLKKADVERLELFQLANRKAEDLLLYLKQADTQKTILERHIFNASSAKI